MTMTEHCAKFDWFDRVANFARSAVSQHVNAPVFYASTTQWLK